MTPAPRFLPVAPQTRLENRPASCYVFPMTITQTVEITDSRRLHLDFEVPLEIPAGKARVELKVIPFAKPDEKPEASDPPKLSLAKKKLDEILEKSPITRELTGILSSLGDISIEQIREERLARHLR